MEFKYTTMGPIIPKEMKHNLHYDDVRGDVQSFQMAAMAANLDFRSVLFELFLIYKLFLYFLPNIESIGLSVQKKILQMAILDFRS